METAPKSFPLLLEIKGRQERDISKNKRVRKKKSKQSNDDDDYNKKNHNKYAEKNKKKTGKPINCLAL